MRCRSQHVIDHFEDIPHPPSQIGRRVTQLNCLHRIHFRSLAHLTTKHSTRRLSSSSQSSLFFPRESHNFFHNLIVRIKNDPRAHVSASPLPKIPQGDQNSRFPPHDASVVHRNSRYGIGVWKPITRVSPRFTYVSAAVGCAQTCI